jgi:hypothetical protein
MMAESGGSLKVRGNSREMDAAGPKPGSTPTKVPATQPIKHSNRFMGSRATWKAKYKLFTKSIFFLYDFTFFRIPVTL